MRDLWPELPKAMKVITNPLVLGLMSALEFVAYRSADACIALAPGIAEGIQRKGGQKGDIHLIPNGCDLKLLIRVLEIDGDPRNWKEKVSLQFLQVLMVWQMVWMPCWIRELS